MIRNENLTQSQNNCIRTSRGEIGLSGYPTSISRMTTRKGPVATVADGDIELPSCAWYSLGHSSRCGDFEFPSVRRISKPGREGFVSAAATALPKRLGNEWRGSWPAPLQIRECDIFQAISNPKYPEGERTKIMTNMRLWGLRA